MSPKTKEIDLVIYSFQMDDTCLKLEGYETLIKAFTTELKEKAVFALTFANRVDDPDTKSGSPEVSRRCFIKEIRLWKVFPQYISHRMH